MALLVRLKSSCLSGLHVIRVLVCLSFVGISTKLMDSRPSSLAKFFSSGCGQELGNTSSSEGEKDSPPPEWDSVPIHKAGSCKY